MNLTFTDNEVGSSLKIVAFKVSCCDRMTAVVI
jgi:hypothetical protein